MKTETFKAQGERDVPLGMVGFSYQTADLAFRERFALGADQVGAALRELPAGSVILATCHRTEVYVAGDPLTDQPDAVPQGPPDLHGALRLLAKMGKVSVTELTPHLIQLKGQAVVLHLMEVAAGLQSMVRGEGEILAQVRQAVELAERIWAESGTAASPGTRRLLKRLFQDAVRAGKRVRTETDIARGDRSLVTAAIDRLAHEGAKLAGGAALVVGGGWMALHLARMLPAAGVARVTVVCRRPDVVRHRLQESWSASPSSAAHFDVVDMDRLPGLLPHADLLCTATSAPRPVVRSETLQAALRQRGPASPLWVVDLAVPRDVEAPTPAPPGLRLFTVDELVGPGVSVEQAERARAAEIVREEAAAYLDWYRRRQAVPLIRVMRSEAERIREAELQRALQKLGSLTPQQLKVVQALSHRLTQKLLHVPTMALQERVVR